jgi:hypothetical protein
MSSGDFLIPRYASFRGTDITHEQNLFSIVLMFYRFLRPANSLILDSNQERLATTCLPSTLALRQPSTQPTKIGALTKPILMPKQHIQARILRLEFNDVNGIISKQEY